METYISDLSGIRHARALVNPISTTIRQGERKLNRLEKAAEFEIRRRIYTSSDAEATDGLIGRILEEEAEEGALIVVSGDGMLNRVVNKIVNDGLSDAAKLTPILALGAGNANAGAQAKHTKQHRKRPELILRDGQIIESNPIRFDIQKPQNKEHITRSAAFFASLGMTALASSDRYLNKPSHRKHMGRYALTRHLSEPVIAARTLWTSKTNTVIQNNQEIQFFDMQFLNSPFMAKYLTYPIRLSEQAIFNCVVPDKKLTTLAWSMKHLLRGTISGDYMKPEDKVYFETVHDIYAQFDGEAEVIPSGSCVSVRMEEQPIRLIISNPDI